MKDDAKLAEKLPNSDGVTKPWRWTEKKNTLITFSTLRRTFVCSCEPVSCLALIDSEITGILQEGLDRKI